jgi:hypothetical protein
MRKPEICGMGNKSVRGLFVVSGVPLLAEWAPLRDRR